ncbi:MAG TPA: Ku protein [Actinomycetota bacterium]|nr:Ku protein [Actinomycetota bacterium]
MPRAIWSGSLTFGLVSVPVKLYNATAPRDVRFHQFERGTGKRIRYRRVTDPAPIDEPWTVQPEEGAGPEPTLEPRADVMEDSDRGALDRAPEAVTEGIPYEQVVKGYELDRDRFVMVSPEELARLQPEPTRRIEIEAFVDLREIDPVHFEKSYYVAPQWGMGAEKPYALLLAALQKANQAGIARFVLRSKEYLAAIRPMADAVVLHTLFFADEVRSATDIPEIPRGAEVAERELRIATQLIELLKTDWNPAEYRDTYRERVLELIEEKAGREPIVAAPEPEARRSEVADLMEALKASVEAAKSKKPARARARTAARKPRRRTAG